MTTLEDRPGLPAPILARETTAHDHAALRHLWLPFRHHMSALTGELPAPRGTYRSERLDHALDPTHPDWAAWILLAGHHPIGFAVTRALDQPTRVLSSFFIVAPARRSRLGLDFARIILAATPGPWSIAYQEENDAAVAFWPQVAARFDSRWRRETHTSPSRPDLPPDTWVTFTAQ